MTSHKTPTIFIILGATGDLMSRKIVPALFGLYQKKLLPPKFRVIGFSRRDLDTPGFRRFLSKLSYGGRTPGSYVGGFLKQFQYCQGDLMKLADYGCLVTALAEVDKEWRVCANKLFYLAIPPEFYKRTLENLAKSGLTKPCGPDEGWTRVLIEKPFGKDLKTAQELDNLLDRLFREIQIYRVDHYLAKEMVQNILNFRFSNNLFEGIWDNRHIEKIDIRLWEKIGVENRGSFYDGLGALKDVGQNHLLQMLALATMENPGSVESEAIRTERYRLLSKLRVPPKEEIIKSTFRSQYRGYRKISGVQPDSNTETYFKILVQLDSPRWRGVPIYLESGKRLSEVKKEIVITLRHPMSCMLCPPGIEEHYKNQIRIALEPKEEIEVYFWSKKEGRTHAIERRAFNFLLRTGNKKIQYVEEYQDLLLEAIAGDQTPFVSTQEVEAMWKLTDSISKVWGKNLAPLHFYTSDTLEPAQEAKKFFAAQTQLAWVGSLPYITKTIGIVGLGKMGSNMARRLKERAWEVAGYDVAQDNRIKLAAEGIETVYSLQDLVKRLKAPRIIWLMLPSGKIIDETIRGLISASLSKGDIIIDGGNSFYKDSTRRYKKLKKLGINFIDVGMSGGPEGARHGSSLMIGGDQKDFKKLEPLFQDLSLPDGYKFFSGQGAGHFVKMVHNGIEYGMMQAIAEGFTILKNSKYKLDLARVADVYNHGSVIESRLVGWLKEAFELYGEDLKNVSGKIAHTGEGEWTVKTAKELGLTTKVIEGALHFRKQSAKNPSYTGKILTALRNRFGGHNIS